ncbi:MAG: nucleotidyltransferase, partial [Acinetobacter sp.]
MGLQSKFSTFNSNIYITRQSEEYKDAREKDDSITEEIRKKFRENGYPVQEDFIQ